MGLDVGKVFSIWSDLESSYAKMNKGESRKEFLLKAMGFSNGRTKLDSLKSGIMAEYAGNEVQCDYLAKIFDALMENVSIIESFEDIKDLNSFVGDLILGKDSVASTQVTVLEEDFFQKLNPYTIPTNTDQLYGFFPLLEASSYPTDVFDLGENDTPRGKFVDLEGDPGVVVFKGGKSVTTFIDKLANPTLFLTKVNKVLSDLIKKEELPDYFVVLDHDKFTQRANRVALWVGGKRVELVVNKKVKLGAVSYYDCSLEIGNFATPIYCIA